MAKLVGVFNTAHSPFCYMTPDNWERVRSNRPAFDPSVPIDDEETNVRKAERIQVGFATLREKLAEVRPDVLVVFGDDQHEIFDFTNHPSIAVFVGESFVGRPPNTSNGGMGPRGDNPVPMATVPGHPALAVHVLTGLLSQNFDPAFMMELPKPENGMCHAVMNPLSSLTDMTVPTVAVLCNAYYAPQLTATRCYEVGKTIGDLIASYSEDLRVAVIGSGGLWHTPGQPGSRLDEQFDREGLEYLARGDVKAWAAHFDAYGVDPADTSQQYSGRGSTNMPQSSGPQGGTREICNWIAAAAVAEGHPEVIVDYVPVYASPIGAAFAYAVDF